MLVEYFDTPPLHGDQARVGQPVQDAREGFRLDAELRGDQALGQIQIDDVAVRSLQLLEQIAHHALADVG